MGWHGIGRVELPELRRVRGFVVVGRVSWDVSSGILCLRSDVLGTAKVHGAGQMGLDEGGSG